MKLPEKFVDNMMSLLGEGGEKFLEALNESNVKALTVDVNKITLSEFEKNCNLDITKIDYLDNAYYYNGKIGKNKYNHIGVVYSQDVSAMLPALALDVQEGDVVLDVCSAPGGKTIQILQRLNNTGLLVCNEYVYSRAKVLYENLVRFGYRNYILTNNKTADFGKKERLFDKVLVDAPCSGEGMFRKHNIDTYYWSEKNVEACAIRQLEILNDVAGLVKANGILVYSTCTYNVEENEKVVVEFLKKHKDYVLCDLPDYIQDNTARGVVVERQYDTTKTGRRYPHMHKGEGQFVAKMMRINELPDCECDKLLIDNYVPIGRKDRQQLEKGLRGIVNLDSLDLYKKGDNIYVVPSGTMDCRGLNVLSVGVCLGTLDRKGVKINHAFYKAYADKFINSVALGEEKVEQYLTGNVVEVSNVPINNIVAVTYNGISVGGGKVIDGTLKNYYPKELRNKE